MAPCLARLSRAAGGVFLLVVGLGCASLIDLPADPQLAEQAPLGPAAGASSDPEVEVGALSEEGRGGEMPASGAPPAEAGELPEAALDRGEASEQAQGVSAPDPDEGASDGEPVRSTVDAGALAERGRDAGEPGSCGGVAVLGPSGDCWQALEQEQSWEEARQVCRALGEGWDLASIRTQEEHEFTLELSDEQAWIGASDAAAEDRWIWVDDGSLFYVGDGGGQVVAGFFEAWAATEPNNRGGADCARTVPGRGTWADLDCDDSRAALCRGPAR